MRPWKYFLPFVVYWYDQISETPAFSPILQFINGAWILISFYGSLILEGVFSSMEPWLVFLTRIWGILKALTEFLPPRAQICESIAHALRSVWRLAPIVFRTLLDTADVETQRLAPIVSDAVAFILHVIVLVLYLCYMFGETDYIPPNDRSFLFFSSARKIQQPEPLSWDELANIAQYFNGLEARGRSKFLHTHDGEVVRVGQWTYEDGSIPYGIGLY